MDTHRVADYEILSGGGSIVGRPLGKWADEVVKRWFEDIQSPRSWGGYSAPLIDKRTPAPKPTH